MQDLQDIHPFNLIPYEEGVFGLYFEADLRYEIFEDLEREVTGYTWVDIIEFFIEHYASHLQGKFEYEPDSDSCELKGEFEDIKAFVLEFRPLYFNDELLTDLIESMEEEWY